MTIYHHCIDIPIGVIYYMWDPRTPRKNRLIAKNVNRLMEQVWQLVLQDCPEVAPLGGFQLHIVYEFLAVDSLMLNHIAACEWAGIDQCYYPSFVFRVPHIQQAKLVNPSSSEIPITGLTKIYYHNRWDCEVLEFYIKTLAGVISGAFRNNIGLTTADLCSSYPGQRLSLAEKKTRLLKDMWAGELMLRQIDDRPIESFDELLSNYDGVDMSYDNPEDPECRLLPYSNGASIGKLDEPPAECTQRLLFKKVRDYAENFIHKKMDWKTTPRRKTFIENYLAADEAFQEHGCRSALSANKLKAKVDIKEAMLVLLDKAKGAGLLDDNFQPVSSLSKSDIALLANKMAYICSISNKWKYFEDLWNVTKLANAYQKAQNRKKSGAFIENLNRIFR